MCLYMQQMKSWLGDGKESEEVGEVLGLWYHGEDVVWGCMAL